MRIKLDKSLRKALADPDEIISVIVIGTSPSALDQLLKVHELRVIRVIGFINAIAARIQAKDVVSLSESPFVRSIELDQEASISKHGPTDQGSLLPY